MRILLADNQPKVRLGLSLLLEQEQDMTVVAEAAEARSLMVQVEDTRPDLVLLDWGLQDTAVVDLHAVLRGLCPDLVVIVLSGRLDVEEVALDAGADAFVSKADPPERLLTVIRSVMQVDPSRLRTNDHGQGGKGQ